MTFSLFDAVALIQDLPSEELHAGMVGAIVDVYTKPTPAYEVEFSDAYGKSIALLALLPEQIRPYTPGDLLPLHPSRT